MSVMEKAEQYAKAMAELGVIEPDWSDAWDVRRALVELRNRVADVSLGPLEDQAYFFDDEGNKQVVETVERRPGAPLVRHQTDLGTLEDNTWLMRRFRAVVETMTDRDMRALRELGQQPNVLPVELQEELEDLAVEDERLEKPLFLYTALGDLQKQGVLPSVDFYDVAVLFTQAREVSGSPDIPKLQDYWGFSTDFKNALGRFYEALQQMPAADPRWRSAYYRAWQNPSFLYDRAALLAENEGMFTDEHASAVRERYAALLNPGKRKRNPIVTHEQKEAITKYLQGKGDEDAAREAIQAAVASGAMDSDWLKDERVAALFPRAGRLKSGTWDAEDRIPEALRSYDMVNRVDKMPPPGEGVELSDPLGSPASVNYLVQSMGISLDEAKRVLKEMKAGAEGRRNKRGERVTIQPSSALIKPYRKRKMPYVMPAKMASVTGPHAVVVLMGPPEAQPRVMTWRRGNHVDLDMLAPQPNQLMQVLSRALQSALLWVGEKPSRGDQTHIYVGQIGTDSLIEVWAPGQPLSLATVAANLQRGRNNAVPWTKSFKDASDEIEAYAQAAAKIKKSIRPPPVAVEPVVEEVEKVVEEAPSVALAAIEAATGRTLRKERKERKEREERPPRAGGREVSAPKITRYTGLGTCPTCGAPPGQPCVAQSGKKASHPHTTRRPAGEAPPSMQVGPEDYEEGEVDVPVIEVPMTRGGGLQPSKKPDERGEFIASFLDGGTLEGEEKTGGKRKPNSGPTSMTDRIKRALGWTG